MGNRNCNTHGRNIISSRPIVVATRANSRVVANGDTVSTISAEISHNIVNLYTIARLSGLGHWGAHAVFSALNRAVGHDPDVPCIQELNDGSWELIVHRGSIPQLQYKLSQLFPGCSLNTHYDPFEPSVDEVERLGYERAKCCSLHALASRAMAIVKEALPVADIYYQYLLDRMF